MEGESELWSLCSRNEPMEEEDDRCGARLGGINTP
jgi:hypothetical protein